MGLFDNLVRIAKAPIDIIDKTLVEPLADVAEMTAEGMGVRDADEDRKRK